MDKILKFCKRLSVTERNKILPILKKLFNNDVSSIRFKKLKGFANLYSIRAGKIRIVCSKNEEKYNPINVDFRKNIYKDL